MTFYTKTKFRIPSLHPVNNSFSVFQEELVYKISNKKVTDKDIAEEVLFICDYEGIIQYQNSNFSFLEPLGKKGAESKNSILDFIHPEDVYLTIESLVTLLQESVDSVVFEARFLCDKKKYYYSKWHVGYLRGMFYFYPLDVPITRKPDAKPAIKPLNKHELFWKDEVVKTLTLWDKTILRQIISSTNI